MKQRLTKKTIAALLAVLLCLSVSIGAAVAYFSDYEEAAGAAEVKLGEQTELTEGNDGDNKHIVVKNTGETNMIVRVAVYGSDEYMDVSYSKDDWQKIGDFYYFKKVLLPQESTSAIDATVKTEWQGKKPDYDFDVTVVHEAAQAVYDRDKLVSPEGWADISNVIAPAPMKGVD